MDGVRVAVAFRPLPRAVLKRLFDGVARLKNWRNELVMWDVRAISGRLTPICKFLDSMTGLIF